MTTTREQMLERLSEIRQRRLDEREARIRELERDLGIGRE